VLIPLFQSGSSDDITDIRPEGGWNVLDCDPTSEAPTVRLVCNSTHPEAVCNHLFRGGDAQGKIVRLPDDVSYLPWRSMLVANANTVRGNALRSNPENMGTRKSVYSGINEEQHITSRWDCSDSLWYGLVFP
jgi:hypothetical protein